MKINKFLVLCVGLSFAGAEAMLRPLSNVGRLANVVGRRSFSSSSGQDESHQTIMVVLGGAFVAASVSRNIQLLRIHDELKRQNGNQEDLNHQLRQLITRQTAAQEKSATQN